MVDASEFADAVNSSSPDIVFKRYKVCGARLRTMSCISFLSCRARAEVVGQVLLKLDDREPSEFKSLK